MHAVFWESGSTEPIDLGTLGGASSEATNINDMGQIVGWSIAESGETYAVFWEVGIKSIELPGMLPISILVFIRFITHNVLAKLRSDFPPTSQSTDVLVYLFEFVSLLIEVAMRLRFC